ncbi:uncharacterized protein DDB_G0287625-like isoform X2 [Polypterus senegalus]|uniref:uncharacterized protein DDB_G0287625-like isoform X2 n=1 Tax=Polypterus senegalus TaxID=55291 RepID=UPI001962C76A|nr:uncharacterized protein DDB_G0287625-like isoform X2 [Polypterus senegalus]
MDTSCYVFFIFGILFYPRTAQAGGLVYGLKNGMVIMSPDFPGNMDEITWKFKEDKVAELNGDSIEYYGIFKNKVILYKNNGSLELKNLQAQDSGKYEVEIVQNGHIKNDIFDLRVIDPVPKPVIECNVTNDHVMLTCKTEMNLLTRLHWNGTDIKNQEITANPLELEKRDDNAEFTCTASNPASEMKSDIFLIKDCNDESNLLNAAMLAVVVVVLILLLLSIIAVGLYFCFKQKENMRLMSTHEMETKDKETDKFNPNQCKGFVGEDARIEVVNIHNQNTDPDNVKEMEKGTTQDNFTDSNKALAAPAQDIDKEENYSDSDKTLALPLEQNGKEENETDSNKTLAPAAQQTGKEENDSVCNEAMEQPAEQTRKTENESDCNDTIVQSAEQTENTENESGKVTNPETLNNEENNTKADCNDTIVLLSEQTEKTENESGKVTNPETLNNEENNTKAGDKGPLEASAEHTANIVKESGSANDDMNKEVKSQDEDQAPKPEPLKNEGNNTKAGSLEASAENTDNNVKESEHLSKHEAMRNGDNTKAGDTGPLDVSAEETDSNKKELGDTGPLDVSAEETDSNKKELGESGPLDVSAEETDSNKKELGESGPLDVSTEKADNNNRKLDKKEDV